MEEPWEKKRKVEESATLRRRGGRKKLTSTKSLLVGLSNRSDIDRRRRVCIRRSDTDGGSVQNRQERSDGRIDRLTDRVRPNDRAEERREPHGPVGDGRNDVRKQNTREL